VIANIGSARWVATLAALTAVTALSIDMSLPAQPTLARVFGVPSDRAQLTLSLFLLGFSLGQLVAGPLSDARGRRPVLLGGLLLYAMAGFVCALAGSLTVLLVCRFIQGAAAAAGPVIVRAMVRDTQPPEGAARLLSTLVAVLAIAPMVAPLIGAVLLAQLGWRAIFAMLGMVGLLFTALAALTLEETRPASQTAVLTPRSIARGFAQFLGAPGTRIPTLLICVSFAGQFAFISASPFVLIDGYGVSPGRFPLYFGSAALALMIGSTAGGRLLRSGMETRTLLVVGSLTMALAGVAAVAGTQVAALGAMGLMVPTVLDYVGIGLMGPSAVALAMEPVPAIAGTASAAIGFLQMASGALSGYLVTRAGGSDPRTLAVVLAGMGLLAAALVQIAAHRRRVQQRLPASGV
jgi:DHA1 family bicyclomycin/chloramphenicol resistance-like MFS transporter